MMNRINIQYNNKWKLTLLNSLLFALFFWLDLSSARTTIQIIIILIKTQINKYMLEILQFCFKDGFTGTITFLFTLMVLIQIRSIVSAFSSKKKD